MDFPRESIFSSSLRSFFKSFFTLLGIFFAFIPIMFLISLFSSDQETLEPHTLTILPDIEGRDEILPPSTPVVLRIDIHGVIGRAPLTMEEMNHMLIDSQRGLLKDGRVRAILLHIDSPGGTATDSDGIYRLLMAYKEKYHIPVHAYVEGLCASGGVYIASAADRTSASAVSIIGSVGVLQGTFFNVSEVLKKWEIQAMTITEGKDKDMLNPTRPWQPGEEESLKKISSSLYERFVSIVTSARPALNKEKLVQEYGAQVYDAAVAQTLGYIDEANSSYEKALLDLLKAANLDEKKPYQVVALRPKFHLLKSMMQPPFSLLQGKVTHTLQLSPYGDLKDPCLYLYEPKAFVH